MRAPRTADREIIRVTDALVVLLVLAAAFVHTGTGTLHGLEGFLAIRVTMKNLLLVSGFILAWQFIVNMSLLYERQRGGGHEHEVGAVAIACTLAALVAAVPPLTGLSRDFGMATVLIFWAGSIPAVLIVRAGVRRTLHQIRSAAPPRQAIIVGSGPRAQAVYRYMHDQPDSGYHVIGFVDSNEQSLPAEVERLRLGELDELEQILVHRNVDVVLITLPARSGYDRIDWAITVCERMGVESRYLADTFGGSTAHHVFEPGPVPAVAMKVVHDDVRLMIKRAFDILASAAGLVVLLPLLIVVALLIRVSSTGPVLFTQERYGRNRRVFRMYKFRTMVADAESLQESLEALNEATGPVFKIREDPRVTRLGRVLRRTSIDELPQLLNVLRGDMSLVGPRPLPLRDVRHFSEAALMRRFSVLPGVTGLWQISGRSQLTFDDCIRLDLKYIDGWSLRLDLLILLGTVPAVIRGRGAS